MAESKKYYWLRLQHDFFTSRRIKKLRSLEHGNEYLIIYLKMQLHSIKDDGLLTYTGLEDSFEKEMALELDEDVGKVRETVKFLIENEMLVEVEDGRYELPYTKSNIGSETESASRMRQLRKRKLEQPKEKPEHSDNIVEHSDNNVTQKQQDKEKIADEYSSTFMEFWEVYPRHDEKKNTYKKYQARLKDGYSPQELLAAAKAYRAECERNRTDKRYIKQGKTFLSDSTPFEDYLPKGGQPNASTSAGGNPFV
jgi:predicted phage replisome organizer